VNAAMLMSCAAYVPQGLGELWRRAIHKYLSTKSFSDASGLHGAWTERCGGVSRGAGCSTGGLIRIGWGKDVAEE
jgi:hypothetical protein